MAKDVERPFLSVFGLTLKAPAEGDFQPNKHRHGFAVPVDGHFFLYIERVFQYKNGERC